ncbi:MAG: hypothetical protein AUH92_06110 [Acidobacteria bacterium 13_1_40CM_4_69_4]|nr:MAG: hypothetical protein AUH92_06110 [Acidobacteria bacterium 13_1_40CM_4_69_4]
MIERRLGQGLHELHSGSLYRPLGYVRLADYLSERLGISLRRCQSLLRMERALRDLPTLAAAFDAGLVPASKIQVLAGAATPATQEIWLARAQRLTVRQLAEQVRVARPDVPDTEAMGADLLVSFAAPGYVVALWHWALDLVRRVAGRQEPAWRCAEYLAAEYLSGAPTASPSSPAASTLSPGSGSEAAARDTAHQAGETGTGGERREGDKDGAASPARPPRDAGGLGAWSEATQAVRDALRPLGAAADPDAILAGRHPLTPDPREGRGLGEPARGGTADGPDPWDLDRRLRALVRLRQSLAWRQGRLLRPLAFFALFDDLGYRSLEDFSTEVLGMSPRRARYLISLERRLAALPLLLDAYRRGLVTWCQARLLVRVAWPGTQSRWIRYARQVTVRRLEDVVTSCVVAAALGNGAIEESEIAPLPPREPKPADRERHTSAPPLPCLPVGGTASGPPAATAPVTLGGGRRASRRISFFAPPDVADLWGSALRTCRATAGTHLRDWECLVLFIQSMREAWENPADPGWRRRYRILERDGWRCRVPGCTSRGHLNVHHVVFRSHQGDDEEDNLVTLCIGHHQAGVHGRLIRCAGRAPDALWWDLGVRSDGPPLVRYFGERIVGAGERPAGSQRSREDRVSA